MKEVCFSILIGYLLGTLSPAAMLAKRKQVNLREKGTKNLGATNTMLVLGKRYGVLVMLFDILKSYVAAKLARKLFPALAVADILAGSACVVGHIYPFYMQFKGGKGLASFGGMILAVDPFLFVLLLLLTLVLIVIINYGVMMAFCAATLFPILYSFRVENLASIMIAISISLLVLCKHRENIGRLKRGEEVKVREYIKNNLFK